MGDTKVHDEEGLDDPASVVDAVTGGDASPQMDRLQIHEDTTLARRTPTAVREQRFSQLRSGSSVDVCAVAAHAA